MSLMEILVALVILAVVAAVVYPTAAAQLRSGHATALANQLSNLRDAITNYRQNVGAYPRTLTVLTTAPTVADIDACGTALSAAEAAAWRGPYINQNIIAAMPVANASVQTALTRAPPTGTNAPGVLTITTTGVDSDIADELEARFDGNANLAAGTVIWTAVSGGTLAFQIQIRGC
jgi:type II secretory pathway pseudopilin PulG